MALLLFFQQYTRPAGSFRAAQPNVVNRDSGLCLNSQGGFAGWPARVWPCSTSHEPKYWGDAKAAITSSVFYKESGEAGAAGAGAVAGGGTVVRFVSNISVHGSWHHPGAAATGKSSGLACLTPSLPVGGDWFYKAGTVGTFTTHDEGG